MPPKRNPITTERIADLARVLRGSATARPSRRRALARARHLPLRRRARHPARLDDPARYLQHLALRVGRGMVVHADRMRANLELTCGALLSQRVLLALASAGMTRDEAYRVTKELAQRALDTRLPLRQLAERPELGLDLNAIFDLGLYRRHAAAIVGRLDAAPSKVPPSSAQAAIIGCHTAGLVLAVWEP